MLSDLTEIQETIDAWFIANKQQALDNLLIAIWSQIESNDYTVEEILRSLVKYFNRQGLSQVAATLEEIVIQLEESSNTGQ